MAVPTRLMTLLLILTLGVNVHADGNAQPGPTLLRKCCPPHQQLNTQLDGCVPWTGAQGAGAPVDADTAWESVEQLRRRIGDGFPWWVNAKTPIYDADADNHTEQPFLDEQEENATLRYGPNSPCPRGRARYFLWNDNKRFRLLRNGTLLLRTDEFEEPKLPIPPDLFCVDRVDFSVPEDHHAYLTCPCELTLCLRKCCAQNQELSITVTPELIQPDCKELEDSMWTPVFYFNKTSEKTTEDVQHILLDASAPECDSGTELEVLNSETDQPANDIRILANGSALMISTQHSGVSFPPTAFSPSAWCADRSVVDGKQRVINALVCMQKQLDSSPDMMIGGKLRVFNSLLCKQEGLAPSTTSRIRGRIYGSLYVVSSLFLVATLLVYALLPDLRKTAYYRSLLCHVTALLAVSLSLASSSLREILSSMEECYLLAFTIQYLILAAFFWLNAVSFDVAWTFREILPTKPSSARERRKFIWYSLYSWGCPAVISAVTAVMNFVEGIPDYLLKPNIHPCSCTFHPVAAQMAYFYGPLAAVLLLNLMLYAYTALQLVRARKDTALVDKAGAGGDSAHSTLGSPREWYILHLKLFLLMGITWVMECVSVAVGQDDAYWYLPDSVNILRGVFVFALLCCKRDVWLRLRARLGALGCCGGSSDGGGSGTGRSPEGGRGVVCGYLGPAAKENQQQSRLSTGATAVTFCEATSRTIRKSVDTVSP